MSTSEAQPPSPRIARRELAAVAASAVVFAVLAGLRAFRDAFPFYDDVAYLRLGNDVRLLGGPLAVVRELFAGRFAESNRHPVYAMLLSFVSGSDADYHRRAQALTVALGVLALIVCWWVARKSFGARPAIVVAMALAVNNTLIDNASHETCEPLLVVFWALSLAAILGPPRLGTALAGGAFAGLAYLTKGTGLFLPICVVLAFAAARRRSRAEVAWVLAFAAAFALIASPLLARNLQMYGSPLYNFNSRFLWIDRLSDFAEIFAPGADADFPRGPFEYLARTTPSLVAWRAGMGIAETTFHFGDALALVSPKAGGVVHIAFAVLGIATGALSIAVLWRSPRSWKRTFLLVQTAWFVAFFIFYNAVSGSSRYLMPATIWLLAVLAERLDLHEARLRRPLFALVAAAVVLTLALGTERPELPPGFAATESWLIAHSKPGDAFAIDARTRLQPEWRMPGVDQVIVSASFRDRPVPPGELIAYLRARHVRWVVLDASSTRHLGDPADPGARRYLLYDTIRLAPDGSLPLEGYPPELTVAWADPSLPRRWVILELAR